MSRKVDCAKVIQDAVTSGAMSHALAGALLTRIDNLAQMRNVNHLANIDQQLKDIAGDLLRSNTAMRVIQKRNALLSIKARREAVLDAKQFKLLGEGLKARIEGSEKSIHRAGYSQASLMRAIQSEYVGLLESEFIQAGLLKDIKKRRISVENIFKEAENTATPGKWVTNDPKAAAAARIIQDVHERMRATANRWGAAIEPYPWYVGRMRWDERTLRKINKDSNVAFQQWKADVLPELDMLKTFGGLPQHKQDEMLRHVFDNLLTGNHQIPDVEANVNDFKIPGSLANKMSEHKVLHWKDAAAAARIYEKYGAKDFWANLLRDVHQRSRAISMLMIWGPNPEANFEAIKAQLNEHAKTMPDSTKQADSLNRSWTLDAAWAYASGKLTTPVNHTWATITDALLTFKGLASLGGVVISSISDLGFMNAAQRHLGMGAMDRFMGKLHMLASKSPEMKEQLRLAGITVDSMIGAVARMFDLQEGSVDWMKRASRAFYSANFLNQWTDAARSAMGISVMSWFGKHADLEYRNLPIELQVVLESSGIASRSTPMGGKMWDYIRQSAFGINGHDGIFITPAGIGAVGPGRRQLVTIDDLVTAAGQNVTPANVARMKDNVNRLFRSMLMNEIDHGVLQPGPREFKYTAWGPPGTMAGTAGRIMMYLSSFPIAVMTRVVAREWQSRGATGFWNMMMTDPQGRMNMIRILAYTTILGYMSNSIRDILKGKTPKPLTENGKVTDHTVKVILESAMRGGAIGYYGDFLFGEYNRSGRTGTAKLMGPLGSVLDRSLSIFSQGVRAESPEELKRVSGIPSVQLIRDNMPFMNLFYLKPFTDTLFWNQLMETLDPGMLERLERHAEREYHQKYFLKPSDINKKL